MGFKLVLVLLRLAQGWRLQAVLTGSHAKTPPLVEGGDGEVNEVPRTQTSSPSPSLLHKGGGTIWVLLEWALAESRSQNEGFASMNQRLSFSIHSLSLIFFGCACTHFSCPSNSVESGATLSAFYKNPSNRHSSIFL